MIANMLVQLLVLIDLISAANFNSDNFFSTLQTECVHYPGNTQYTFKCYSGVNKWTSCIHCLIRFIVLVIAITEPDFHTRLPPPLPPPRPVYWGRGSSGRRLVPSTSNSKEMLLCTEHPVASPLPSSCAECISDCVTTKAVKVLLVTHA